MFKELEIQCPFCNKLQTAFVDPKESGELPIVVDCTQCCHPMDIRVRKDENDEEHIQIEVSKSGGF